MTLVAKISVVKSPFFHHPTSYTRPSANFAVKIPQWVWINYIHAEKKGHPNINGVYYNNYTKFVCTGMLPDANEEVRGANSYS